MCLCPFTKPLRQFPARSQLYRRERERNRQTDSTTGPEGSDVPLQEGGPRLPETRYHVAGERGDCGLEGRSEAPESSRAQDFPMGALGRSWWKKMMTPSRCGAAVQSTLPSPVQPALSHPLGCGCCARLWVPPAVPGPGHC